MDRKSFPIRREEREFIRTDKRPQIDSTNAHLFCSSKTDHVTENVHFKKEFTSYRFKGDFIFIPNALAAATKREIAHLTLSTLLYPPYKTSIGRSLDIENIDLFQAFKEGRQLEVKRIEGTKRIKVWKDPSKSHEHGDDTVVRMSALELIRLIRWSSLGTYYDWEDKEYKKEIEREMPAVIKKVCKYVSSEICSTAFSPETAIVNYYHQKHRIMAHVDEYEEDMSKPLISLSFGCSCVFLVGGREEADEVLSFTLEDGDIAILLNESRYFYHGVPKILSENKGEYDSEYDPLIEDARINISVRQIYKEKER